MKILFCFILLNSLFLVSCQNRPCREIQAEKMAEKKSTQSQSNEVKGATESAKATVPTAGAGNLRVKVYKPDGSLQCGMGSKISLEAMEKELKGIKVFSKTNMNDGLMRIQVCGAPTGQSNVFEINRTDLEKALKAGFKEWLN